MYNTWDSERSSGGPRSSEPQLTKSNLSPEELEELLEVLDIVERTKYWQDYEESDEYKRELEKARNKRDRCKVLKRVAKLEAQQPIGACELAAKANTKAKKISCLLQLPPFLPIFSALIFLADVSAHLVSAAMPGMRQLEPLKEPHRNQRHRHYG
jgi:hypothetical protein